MDNYALTVMRNKYADDIEDLLSCPVCFEQPIGDIPTCNNGHHICQKCSKNVRKCPQCQGTFNGARNYMAETLSAKFNEIKDSLLDPNHKSNRKVLEGRCTSYTQTDPLIFHKMNKPVIRPADTTSYSKQDFNVEKAVYPCILNTCKNQCYDEDIVDHIQKSHPENFIEIEADAEAYVFFQQSWNINEDVKNIDFAINVKSKGLFFFNVIVNEPDQLHGNIRMLSNSHSTIKIFYFIEIEETTDEEQASKAYDGTVQPLSAVKNNEAKSNDKTCVLYKFANEKSNITCTLKLYHCIK